jgi:hypothetical protein
LAHKAGNTCTIRDDILHSLEADGDQGQVFERLREEVRRVLKNGRRYARGSDLDTSMVDA